jgi:hypothetical protein
MILRRITQHVRDQNWTAVGIDFLIVVVGVFVGLQASTWNAERIDRSREAAFLTGLAGDVESDLTEIDGILAVSTVRLSSMTWLIETATGEALPDGFESARGRIEVEDVAPFDEADPQTLGVALFILTTLDGERLTFDTMINTGGTGVLRDASLVREIQAYYARVDQALHFEAQLERSRVVLVDAQQQTGLSPVDASPAGELARRFGADPSLTAAAKNYWLFTNRHLKIMRELRREAERLLARVAAAQGTPRIAPADTTAPKR